MRNKHKRNLQTTPIYVLLLWFFFLLLLFTACSNDPQRQADEDEGDDARVVNVHLEVKSWQEVQEWVASKKGKVVVVDVWSTSCLPCIKEFPHFVDLHNEYRDEVACASLSVDFYGGEGNKPEDVQEKVQEFLNSQAANMRNFISSDPDEEVLKEINTAVIPAVLVYDQQGNLAKIFNNDGDEFEPGVFSYEKHITPMVKKLLNKEGA